MDKTSATNNDSLAGSHALDQRDEGVLELRTHSQWPLVGGVDVTLGEETSK